MIPPSGGVLQAQVHCNRTLGMRNVNVTPSRSDFSGSSEYPRGRVLDELRLSNCLLWKEIKA